jgi:glycosyltransferase involved in cell wall biosynthesis
MAVGRPVIFIGPEGSEAAMAVREAQCGEVFPPRETEKAALVIRDLACERERREHLGASGRRYFETMLGRKFAVDRFRAVFLDLDASTQGKS